MIWDGDQEGIEGDNDTDSLTIENCTIDWIRDDPGRGISADDTHVTVVNTIVTRSTTDDFTFGGGYDADIVRPLVPVVVAAAEQQ